mgnify:CR=1 FL=1
MKFTKVYNNKKQEQYGKNAEYRGMAIPASRSVLMIKIGLGIA